MVPKSNRGSSLNFLSCYSSFFSSKDRIYRILKSATYGFGISGLTQLLFFKNKNISLLNKICLYGTMLLCVSSGGCAYYTKLKDRSLKEQRRRNFLNLKASVEVYNASTQIPVEEPAP